MRLVLIAAALALPMAFAATAADAHGCGRHAAFGEGDSLRHLAFNRALLGVKPDCDKTGLDKTGVGFDKASIEERRARRAARGGFFETHGRYTH